MSGKLELKAPAGHYRIVGSKGSRAWLIDDVEDLKEAIDIAGENKAVGEEITVYDDEGGVAHSE